MQFHSKTKEKIEQLPSGTKADDEDLDYIFEHCNRGIAALKNLRTQSAQALLRQFRDLRSELVDFKTKLAGPTEKKREADAKQERRDQAYLDMRVKEESEIILRNITMHEGQRDFHQAEIWRNELTRLRERIARDELGYGRDQ